MPPGTYLNGWIDAMANRARADQYVLYDREWYQGGTQPGPGGQVHLQRIARNLPHEPYSVVIEPTDPPSLAESRRKVVVAYLAGRGITDANVRVIIGVPEAEGLRLNDPPRRMGGTGITGGPGGGVGGGANSMNGFGGSIGGGSIGGGSIGRGSIGGVGGYRGY